MVDEGRSDIYAIHSEVEDLLKADYIRLGEHNLRGEALGSQWEEVSCDLLKCSGCCGIEL